MRAAASLPTTSSSRKARLASQDAPGYSSSKAFTSARRAEVASALRAPPPRSETRALSSGLDRDLDTRRSGDAGAVHGLAQPGAACVRLGLFEAWEAAEDVDLAAVAGIDQD